MITQIIRSMMVMALMSVTITMNSQSLTPKKDSKKPLWGYVDSQDKWVVKPKFDQATEFYKTPAGQMRSTVTLKGKKGLVDENGKILGAGVVFDEITPIEGSNNLFVVVKGKTGIADYNCAYLVKPEAETVEQLGNEGWIITIKGKKGIIKKDGSFLVEPLYTEINHTVPDYFIVNQGGKAGLLKRDGQIVVAPKDFTAIAPFKDNYWVVNKGAKQGLYNIADGKLVIKPDYDSVLGVYCDGKCVIVKKGNKTDILNELGKRRMRYTGYDIKVQDFIKDALLIIVDEKENEYALFLPQNGGGVWDIDRKVEQIGDFVRVKISPIPNKNYYSAKDAIEQISNGSNQYLRLNGESTDYVDAYIISDSLYCMATDTPGTTYLYKKDQSEALGVVGPMSYSITRSKNGSKIMEIKDGVLAMENGEMFNLYGNPIELIMFDDKPVAAKDKITNKYCFAEQSADPKGFKLNHPEKQYDIIRPSACLTRPISDDGFRYFAKDGDQAYIVDRYFKHEPIHGTISIKNIGDYKIVCNEDGLLGVVNENDNKTILEPKYEELYCLSIYDKDSESFDYGSLFKIYDGDKVSLIDIETSKTLIPFDKGYTNIGGVKKTYAVAKRYYDSNLCYVQTGSDEEEPELGLWNLKLGKEILKPSKSNNISTLPTGYKGYVNNGKAYDPTGKPLNFSPAIDVYQAEWANSAPYFFVKMLGLAGRTVEFVITGYEKNGSIHTNQFGQKCVHVFSQTETPETTCEYGPRITAYIGDSVYLPSFTNKTITYKLSARDAKTKAPIPVKGETSVQAYYERKW